MRSAARSGRDPRRDPGAIPSAIPGGRCDPVMPVRSSFFFYSNPYAPRSGFSELLRIRFLARPLRAPFWLLRAPQKQRILRSSEKPERGAQGSSCHLQSLGEPRNERRKVVTPHHAKRDPSADITRQKGASLPPPNPPLSCLASQVESLPLHPRFLSAPFSAPRARYLRAPQIFLFAPRPEPPPRPLHISSGSLLPPRSSQLSLRSSPPLRHQLTL